MNLTSFKSKLFKPCKKILHIFKFKLHKKVLIKALQLHHFRKPKVQKLRFPKIRSVLHSLRRPRKMDRATELEGSSYTVHHDGPYTSPITPAYIRLSRPTNRGASDQDDDVEDACRSFESYLIEMIIEEGKMRDLVDVEELLYCWKNLRCPIFTDLVCRFYRELCKDLFSESTENE